MPPGVNDPMSLNVAGVKELIGSKVNKIGQGSGDAEGATGEVIDELTLKLSDEELLALRDDWEGAYAPYIGKITERQNANKKYYLGRQLEGTQYNVEFPIAANLLFEAEETFLPAALSKNPEPVVWADNTTEGNALSQDVKTMLQYHADTLVLRRKLTLMVRHWSIYYLGIIKHGWNKEINDISSEIRKPQNFILDPEGYVDVYGDFIGYLGERITITASKLIKQFPKHEDYILAIVKGKKGTSVTYTEWWNDDYCFYTFKDIVLDKHKNPHFSYDKETEEPDEDGVVVKNTVAGNNHFANPKKPYTFLSVFSLGEQPHDVTSLIEQNIPNQNLITKRTMQIDTNLSRQNNSVAFSEDNFTQQTAKQAAGAFEKGNPLLVPAGRPISEAIMRFPAESYPDAAFRELDSNKQNLRSSFGTQGITAEQPKEEQTARGMILNQQRDNTRIGGGIGDALEQVADNIFNWWVQLYYKYYDEPHEARILGGTKATEFVQFSNADLNRRLVISVTPDSMKPKDEIAEQNQAMSLWEQQAIDLKTLLTILNVPDVQKTAENTMLWIVDKNAYMQLNFPELSQKLAMMQQSTPQGAPAPVGGAQPTPTQSAPSLGGEPPSASLSQVPIPA